MKKEKQISYELQSYESKTENINQALIEHLETQSKHISLNTKEAILTYKSLMKQLQEKQQELQSVLKHLYFELDEYYKNYGFLKDYLEF